jgi:hypothetical protein
MDHTLNYWLLAVKNPVSESPMAQGFAPTRNLIQRYLSIHFAYPRMAASWELAKIVDFPSGTNEEEVQSIDWPCTPFFCRDHPTALSKDRRQHEEHHGPW